jgi:Sulfotransferase family
VPETPYGRIELHHHRFHLRDVPAGDHVFFCVRDPITRYVSGFCSRLNEGRPHYHFEWTENERKAFEAFPTPQRLAAALISDDEDERLLAQWAMQRIRHLGRMQRSIGEPARLRRHLGQVVYIARQETLEEDWRQIKARFGLPEQVRLPADPRIAHRRDASLDDALDDRAQRALRDWYAADYRLLEYCEQVRLWHGWGRPAATGPGRLPYELQRLRAMAAVLTGARVRRTLRSS